MKKIITRKQKNETGLAKACQAPRGYEFFYSGEWIGYVSPQQKEAFSREYIGWKFTVFDAPAIGLIRGTSKKMFISAEEARDAALEYMNKKMKESGAVK